MKRCFFLLVILVSLPLALFWQVGNVEAKMLPQAKKAGQKAVKSSPSTSIGVYPYLKDRRNLAINFSNLQNATAVSYLLTYKTNTQEEAAMGGLNLTGVSKQSAQLYLGTCSKNDCRPHIGVSNAKLEVSYTLKSGKKYLKKYRLKV